MSDLFEQFSQAELVPIIPPAEPEPSPAAAEILVASADCPTRVHRVTQKMLFDVSEQYR